ncbi:MAG: translesion error-prone DNA polymerase V autoproteolytic subunit [Glaciimonas sp.]|nr:translesion error-prone DNA polymerase V autoproteolytic subunit [Glaciimonas sp.]
MFLEKIPAGFPSPASDYIEAGLDLNAYLVAHKASTFVFQVKGDSMSGIGILDGDKLTVDRSIEPRHKHIIVAVLNNEFTVKRLYRWGGVIELRAENPAYAPIRCKDFEEIQVWGVVTGVLRKLQV